MRIVVCGSRDWIDEDTVRAWLRRLAPNGERFPPINIAHGACHLGGADEIVDRVARKLGYEVWEFPVDIERDGPWPGAGPRRNARMLDASKTDRVLAFSMPGERGEVTRGTYSCCMLAFKRGVPVTIIPAGSRP